ncbi:MAG: L-serine ammonia-lyase, iron-sulfur-dependent, subunit alpha, partial [Megasphaera elsdenii]|nr:L-serine ammonia-lyase, iron-sulfur-dependent, subunit alpha [Megasphaera elsdenii]
MADIVDFAEQVPLEDIAFLKEAERLNDHLSQEGLTGKYGLKIGYTLQQLVEKGVLADDLSHRIQIRTVAASDARMGGAAFPAMTNSGSGNQGIAAT